MQMTNNGVIMLVNEFPPLPIGGAERQVERLSTWLAARGWDVRVLTRGAFGIPAREVRNGYAVWRIRPRGFGKLRSVTFVVGSICTLFRQRSEYKILHAHLAFGAAFAAVIAARFLRKRVIVKFGNSGEFGDLHSSERTLRGRLRLWVFRRWADVIIALDGPMQAEAIRSGFDSSRVRLMNNGIDFHSFSAIQSRIEAKDSLGLTNRVVVLFIGRMTQQKSLPTLLRAFAVARMTCPDLHLLLVGDGPARESLERQAASLDLASHLTFAGAQSNVRPFLEGADLFALPSLSEGISNALLEAMSAGIACIATPVGGTAEVLDNGKCGLLVPAINEAAWARALVELGTDPARRERLGRAAQQRVRERYDFSVVGHQYEELYNSLMEAPSRK